MVSAQDEYCHKVSFQLFKKKSQDALILSVLQTITPQLVRLQQGLALLNIFKWNGNNAYYYIIC